MSVADLQIGISSSVRHGFLVTATWISGDGARSVHAWPASSARDVLGILREHIPVEFGFGEIGLLATPEMT